MNFGNEGTSNESTATEVGPIVIIVLFVQLHLL